MTRKKTEKIRGNASPTTRNNRKLKRVNDTLKNLNKAYSKLAWPMKVTRITGPPKKKPVKEYETSAKVKYREIKKPIFKFKQDIIEIESLSGGYKSVKLHSTTKKNKFMKKKFL
jgi:hypothetical protein